MFSALDILGYYQYTYTYIENVVESLKIRMREYLGPQLADRYFILASGDVIASTTSHNHDQESSALIYCTATRQIVRNMGNTEERLQRIPYLTLIHRSGDQEHDFSEWISEVRTVRQPTLIQLVRLAGLLHNVYLNEHCGSEVVVITRAGDEETFAFKNTTELVKKEIRSSDAMGTGLELSDHARA